MGRQDAYIIGRREASESLGGGPDDSEHPLLARGVELGEVALLNGPEGLLVASKIADRVGITRSVIVNALRKFESAGLIETKSLGMKGTYIRVLNDLLFEELKNRTKRRF